MAVQNQEIQSVDGGSAQPPVSATDKSRDSNNFMFGVIILLVVLGLAGAGFLFLQQLRTKQEGLDGALDKEDKRLIEVTKQMTTLQSQMATIEQKLGTQDSQFERIISEHADRSHQQLSTAKEELDDAIQRIQRQLGKTRGDWLVADAEYLLSVANERLHLVGDIKTTLLAMEAADQRLRESGDPGVFKVREAVAKEMDTLKQVDNLDIVGLSAKLIALGEKVSGIPLILPHAGRIDEIKQQPSKQDEQVSNEKTGDFFGEALSDLKDLVKVTHSDRAVTAVLLPEEATLIRQSLQMKLEMARAALIQRNQSLYQKNLDAALSWLSENFNTEMAETKTMVSEIQKLKDVPLAVEFPDISESLVLLRNVTKLRIEADKSMQPSEPEQSEGGF